MKTQTPYKAKSKRATTKTVTRTIRLSGRSEKLLSAMAKKSGRTEDQVLAALVLSEGTKKKHPKSWIRKAAEWIKYFCWDWPDYIVRWTIWRIRYAPFLLWCEIRKQTLPIRIVTRFVWQAVKHIPMLYRDLNELRTKGTGK